ncbi:MAG: c-type cytochrome [Planctomycetaceae bacterium]|nr:c-type cytochrome [Planctomycetaceae bacterium]
MPLHAALRSVTCLFALSLPFSATLAVDPKVPDGFTIEKVAGHPLLERPIFAGFDETGRLFVGESNGENLRRDEMLAKKPHWISCLEDTDGDGVFDKSTRFVEDITLPQGCLWYRGSLYAACPPSIWKFTDTDGDGKADERKEILTGFGFSGNACDTHGPFLSPTGRFYIVQGRHGHEFKDENGNVYSKGKAGRIYSCRPDGSDVRVHAGGGFDNPVEVDFTEEGECIGTVNILYRDRGDCLMHWVEGGVYPREDQADAVAEFKWTGGLLGPVHNLGHVACSGIMRYRGTHFGDEFKNTWFFTEFNTHKVRYAELKRAGSTFTADVHEFLHCDDGDFHPTDVLEDADGSLLVLNTGAWFLNGCPTSRVSKPEIYGGIYRIRKIGGTIVEDPRGTKLDLAKQSPEVWIQHLNDRRFAVRAVAKNLLGQMTAYNWHLAVGRHQAGELHTDQESPIQLDRHYPIAESAISANANYWACLPNAFESTDVTLRTVSANSVADYAKIPSHFSDIVYGLSLLLDDEHPQTRHAAIQAISRLAPKIQSHLEGRDVPGLVEKLLLAAQSEQNDSFLDHQIIVALMRLASTKQLADEIKAGHSKSQRAALIALDQMDDSPLTRDMVLPLLSSDDSRLQQTALEVIARHPGWAAETLALLKTWIAEPDLNADRANALRGFLLAQLNDAAVQEFLAQTLRAPDTSNGVRALLWEVLQRSTLAAWPESFHPLLAEALGSPNGDVVLAALRIVTQRSLTGFDEGVRRLTLDDSRSLAIRCEAVAALGMTPNVLDDAVFQSLADRLGQEDASSDEKAMIGRALGNGPLSESQLAKLTAVFDAAGPLVAPVLIKAFARSTNEELGLSLVTALLATDASASVAPDELAALLRKYPEGVRKNAEPLFKKLGIDPVAQEARLAELSPLVDGGDPAAGRNIFFGRKAACGSCHAVGSEGGRVGPHLTTIGASRSAKDLLEAIVYPSASFVNGYRTTLVVTVDGKVLQGVISAETTDTITLRTKDLQELRVRRDDIDEMRESSTSIMPAGLDRQLTPEELQHLLAYLRSRK